MAARLRKRPARPPGAVSSAAAGAAGSAAQPEPVLAVRLLVVLSLCAMLLAPLYGCLNHRGARKPPASLLSEYDEHFFRRVGATST